MRLLPSRAIQGDVMTLFAVNIIIMLVGFGMYKLLPSLFGQSAFYEYSLAKRFQAFALPLSLCGLGTILPRNIARCRENARQYLAAGFVVVGLSVAATFAIALFMWQFAITLAKKWEIYQIFLFLSVPPLLSGLFFSYFRGMGEIRKGVLALLVFNVVAPLGAILFSGTLRQFAIYNSVLSGIAGLFFAYRIFYRPRNKVISQLRSCTPKLALQGLGRVPGDASFQLLLTAPVLIAARYADVESAGTVAFMVATLTLMAFPLKPLSTVLLTEVARSPSPDHTKGMFQKVVMSTTLVGVIACVAFYMASGHYFKYFGIFTEIGSVAALSLAAFGYIFYIAVRSFLDALGSAGAPSVPPSLGLIAFMVGYAASLAADISGASSLLFSLALGTSVMASSVLIMATKRLDYGTRS